MTMEHPLGHSSNANISMALQFIPKKKYIDDKDEIIADTWKLQKYLEVHGMIERYEDQKFTPFNVSVNKDLDTWKGYQNNIKISETGQIEMIFDLSDAII